MENVSHNTSYESANVEGSNGAMSLENLSLRESHHNSCVFLCYVIYKVNMNSLKKANIFERIKSISKLKEFELMVD